MLTGDWNDLERYLSLGLRIIGVEMGRDGIPVITAEIPEKVRMEMGQRMSTDQRMGQRKPSLAEIMRDLAARAEQDWGQVQRRMLSRGLGIDLICRIDGVRRLQIWRERVYPAAKEWGIVVGVCPGAPKKVEFEQFMSKGRGYLRGGWVPATGSTSTGQRMETDKRMEDGKEKA